MMLLNGNCLDKLKELPDNSIDSIVTDPPYGLSFMGKKWDYDVPCVEIWKEALRVLKPGGHLLSFGGTRTYHRMVVNIEDAGFEIRDCIQWLYGSGFPKSHNIKDGAFKGYGTALKPANEPIVVARKPLEGTVAQNVAKYGTGAINIDGSRIGTESTKSFTGNGNYGANSGWANPNTKKVMAGSDCGRWPANIILDEFQEQVLTLKDSIDCGIKQAIEVYYASYGPLQNLQKEDDDIPESQRSKEILLERMLLQRSNQKTGANDRKDSLSKDTCKDKKDKELTGHQGQEECEISGNLYNQRLSGHLHSRDTNSRAKEIQINVQSDREELLHGTSIGDGKKSRQTLEGFGNCSSQEWDQARQPNSKSRTKRHEPSQEGTLASIERGEKATCLVRESDVPQVWMQYFESSGFTVRAGAAQALDEQSGIAKPKAGRTALRGGKSIHGSPTIGSPEQVGNWPADTGGGASRFFYVAKASKSERNAGLEGMPLKESGIKNDSGRGFSESDPHKKIYNQNFHPTVKPIKLMQYLINLVTPPNGTVLDPFMGSGSTGVAAKNLNHKFVGIELSEEYFEIAKKRIGNG